MSEYCECRNRHTSTHRDHGKNHTRMSSIFRGRGESCALPCFGASNVNVPFTSTMDRLSEFHLAKGTVKFCCIIHNDCTISLRPSSTVYKHALLWYPINYPIPWRKTFLENFTVKSSTLLECCAVSIGECLPFVGPIFEFEVTGDLNFH